MLLCSVVAHIVAYNTTTIQYYNTTKCLFLCFCSLLRSWQYTASGGFSGQCVARSAAQLPLSRATGPTASSQVCPARRTDARGAVVFLVKLSPAGTGSHCWQDVPCASKPRRYCIQGVCIRRVPPFRSMDIDRVTRLARHTGFVQPALLRLAPFCSRYNAGTFRLFTKYQGRGEVRSGCHPVIEKTDTRM